MRKFLTKVHQGRDNNVLDIILNLDEFQKPSAFDLSRAQEFMTMPKEIWDSLDNHKFIPLVFDLLHTLKAVADDRKSLETSLKTARESGDNPLIVSFLESSLSGVLFIERVIFEIHFKHVCKLAFERNLISKDEFQKVIDHPSSMTIKNSVRGNPND